ncbi:hypothetical protein SARC_00867 [Sphaeroforma arctica JP610]|uniref:Uncharacterized protein n=1 Tax=Sphaeroforma arctica JP610 TaxID=667725 RepID=A0A0L0GDM5_9EUKA|nr:hypothetical protein SARC_00867 [Sphaeroforma arctica JP610]KNC87014.1 hypothetical protein SARC_00867 [Sphaeroforma arctica JP610]|eukprot:XP_014160916.1 hypothetical protein SARC_00867 [Sphaeroforma arctica JP610]
MPPRKRKTKAAVQDATSSKKSSGPDESYGNAWLYFASMLGVAVCAMAATVMISLNQQHHVCVNL